VNQPPLLQGDDGAVRVLTLNRPQQRNAFDVSLYQALTGALLEADSDESVRAVVITGAGPAFSAGTDLGELAAMAAGSPPEGMAGAFPGLLAALAEIDVPLIAAVQGPGVGLGATMLSFCDLVIIADTAGLKAPFAEMGVPPEAASSYLFPVRMGWPRAARMLLGAGWLSAVDAVACGLATAHCAREDVLPEAIAAAQQIAGHERAATRTIKALMRAGERDAIVAARRREDEAYQSLFGNKEVPS
jgi:enoyl-CoA hydratase/carnithine racemase